jgi:hypothetical protein
MTPGRKWRKARCQRLRLEELGCLTKVTI